jgi:hypothetical protein
MKDVLRLGKTNKTITTKRIMSWEEWVKLRNGNNFRTTEFEPIYKIELNFTDILSTVDTVMAEQVSDHAECFEIMSASLFGRLYETYEELRERLSETEEGAVIMLFDMMYPFILHEQFDQKYWKEIKELIIQRHHDEWGTFWVALEDKYDDSDKGIE